MKIGKYAIEKRIWNPIKKVYEWKPIRPSSGDPYKYDTREEAERMSRLCYDTDSSIVRIKEV